MVFLGVDPGCRGAIAAINHEGQILGVQPFAAPTQDVIDWIHLIQDSPMDFIKFATLERVSATPQMGVVSAFTFGRAYGLAETLLAAFAVPFERVAPRVWQKLMKCETGGDKNVSKARAYELWPNMKFTHQTADACLIAEYCRRTYHGRKDGE